MLLLAMIVDRMEKIDGIVGGMLEWSLRRWAVGIEASTDSAGKISGDCRTGQTAIP